MRSVIPAAFAVLLSLIALPAYAVGEGFDVSFDTDYLSPYATVRITPESSSVALERASITSTVAGKVVAETSGTEPIAVQLGAPGAATTVLITAKVDGQTYTKSVTLRPQDVSLIVEPAVATHPLYAGGGIVTPESSIRVIAVADLRDGTGRRIPASQLSYTWKFGDQFLTAQSGIGKSVLSADAPVKYRDATLSLTVQTVDQSLIGGAIIRISPADPLIRIYRNDPLLGPDYDNALGGSYTMEGSEETFRAVPYFFAATPALSWTVNSVDSGSDRDVTVRTTGSGAGTATLGISATRSDVFQTAAQTLSVAFGASTGGLGIFGL